MIACDRPLHRPHHHVSAGALVSRRSRAAPRLVLGAVHVIAIDPVALGMSTVLVLAGGWIANQIFARVFGAIPNIESVYITGLIIVLIMDPAPLGDLSAAGAIVFASAWAMASKFISVAAPAPHLQSGGPGRGAARAAARPSRDVVGVGSALADADRAHRRPADRPQAAPVRSGPRLRRRQSAVYGADRQSADAHRLHPVRAAGLAVLLFRLRHAD